MRNTKSTHNVPIRTQAAQIWRDISGFRPNLNIPLLTTMILNAVEDNNEVAQKRKATLSSQDTLRNKRARTKQGIESHSGRASYENDTAGADRKANSNYPAAEPLLNHALKSGFEVVPVLRHVINLEFDVSEESPGNEIFRGVLLSLSESLSSARKFDIGGIRLGQYQGRFVVMSDEDRCWLLLVPSLTIDADTNDLQNSSANDLLSACGVLQQYGHAQLQATLQMVLHPSAKWSLQLEIVAAIVIPAILEFEVPKNILKKSVIALEDARRRLLRAAYSNDPVVSTQLNDPITISSFYNILGEAPALPSAVAEHALQCKGLLPTLLPFQKRSVAWLLGREGMSLTPDGALVPQPSPKAFSFWQKIHEGNHTWYWNRLSGELLDEAPDSPTVHGGMLAEEPGLGKTVETIALILMNPAPPEWNPTRSRWDANSSLDVQAVKSTLIVTPPALASQWRAELATHAPSLKVLVYDGWNKTQVPITQRTPDQQRVAGLQKKEKLKQKRATKKVTQPPSADAVNNNVRTHDEDGNPLTWCDYVHQYDVVITTYATLRSEIHVARAAPNRPRREDALYSKTERTRSPLVMVEWKRVVMDEVQMVGGGSAAEMVSLIPRLSSLAVSGTPAKAQMSDLIHVLKFLRIDQIVGDLRLWKRLLKPGFAEEFSSFLRHYGIRTTKSSVANELTIPEQTRYLVGIDLGKIERHVYDQTLEQALLELGLDARGVAATSNWQVDSALLRTSLRKIRGICTHPQVGNLQRKGDGSYRPNALKSMDAVLQLMRDQNWKNLMEDWRTKIQTLVKQAQLQTQDDTVPDRHQITLKLLELAEKEIVKHIDEIQDTLAKHDAMGREMKEEAARLRLERSDEDSVLENGKGKAKDSDKLDEDEDEEVDDDTEEKGLPKTPAGEEHRNKRGALKMRLREARVIMHRVHFLLGDAHHVLGNADMEAASYEKAEMIRRGLLRSSEQQASRSIAALADSNRKKNQSLTESNFLIEVPVLADGGIRSAHLMEELNTMVDDVLNEQSKLLWAWRSHILDLLSRPVNSGESEADGQEYQRTLDEQGEVEIYLQCYVAVLADRREALVNERTLLAAHDVREKRLRHTKAAMKAAAAAAGDTLLVPDGLDIQPDHEVMHSTLSKQRKDLLAALSGRAVKSILVDLHGIYLKIMSDNDPEKLLIKIAMEQIRALIAEQSALHEKIEKDLVLLRKSFNLRVTYFGQLQEISDSVADVECEEETIAAEIQVCVTERANLDAKINTTRARYRYLDNLSMNKDSGPDDEKDCVLCRCEFTRGYVTHCGHVFCEDCMKAWLYRKVGKTCPVCRVGIDVDTIQRFVIQSDESTKPPPKLVAGEPVPQSRRTIIYNTIPPALFEEIQSMETYGDFGSKIQTLVRHLAHIKATDPGAKSIIFSAWADSLHIVDYALKENGIRALRIDQGASTIQKFRTDPDILVLLLHGERENAGLNVTCASRVFLLESVVHHSFEIQAIARIDRLGQTRLTEVYCYYAEDTVERNILDLAARKGLSLYTSENSKGTVSVSPFNKENEEAVDDPTNRKMLQKGDFIYKVDDMLAILFPHMFEDTEFLLPPSALVLAPLYDTTGDVDMIDAHGGNAVAGPSRLP